MKMTIVVILIALTISASCSAPTPQIIHIEVEVTTTPMPSYTAEINIEIAQDGEAAIQYGVNNKYTKGIIAPLDKTKSIIISYTNIHQGDVITAIIKTSYRVHCIIKVNNITMADEEFMGNSHHEREEFVCQVMAP